MLKLPPLDSSAQRQISRRDALRLAGNVALSASAASAFALGPSKPTRAALQDSDKAQTLTVAANWSPVDLDPHGARDPGSGLVVAGVFESLIKVRPGTTREYVPVLATSWESSSDFSRWNVILREGVVFHDGTPCDARTVRDSYERLFALALAPAEILSRFITSIEQIQVVDELTITFDLDRPQRLFEAALAAPYGTAIVNVAAALAHERDGDWGYGWSQTNAEGLGTGPFRFVSFDPLDGVVLERFEPYWGGWERDHFDIVVIRSVPESETRRELIEQGKADIVQNIPREAVPSLSEQSSVRVDRGDNLLMHYLVMTVSGPLESALARQAMCWAFPYEEVLIGVYGGYADQGRSAVSELCHGFSAVSPFFTDQDQARTLLSQAGVPEGTKITTVYPPGNALVQSIMELFQAHLAQIGIELEIQPIDFASYTQMIYSELPASERPHLLPLLWQPDYDDAWSQLWPTTSCETWTGGNIGQYCNGEVDELLLAARDSTDERTYLDALARAQQIVVVDDPVAIYLAQPEWITVLRSDVGGFVLNKLAGEFLDYHSLFRQQ